MAKRRLMRRQVVIAALVGSLAGSGCVRTVTYRAARFEPGVAALPTTQPVRTAAVWKVKVRGNGEKEYHGIDGTERLLQRGDVVGFRRGEDGVVYAVANRDQIPLALTDDHERVVWQAKEKKPTEFAEGVADVVAMMAGAVMVAGIGVGLGALWLISEDLEHDRREREKKRRYGHGY
jgi:hypothetical protein